MTAHNQTDIRIIPQMSAVTKSRSVLSPNFVDNVKTFYLLVEQGVYEERIYLPVNKKTWLWGKKWVS